MTMIIIVCTLADHTTLLAAVVFSCCGAVGRQLGCISGLHDSGSSHELLPGEITNILRDD